MAVVGMDTKIYRQALNGGFLSGEVVIEFVQDQEHNRVELLVLILSSFL